jgi:histidyl-tRNA synthetase
MRNLGIQHFTLKINNRKILAGIAEAIGMPGQEGPLSVAIDKLDKIGKDKVSDELRERGFSEKAIDELWTKLVFDRLIGGALTKLDERVKGSNDETLDKLKLSLESSETGIKGIAELRETMQLATMAGLENAQIDIDPTLARGLSYYTGAIFEVKANGVSIGSISGGGRYDNLTGALGMPGLSGVGISFGVDRIYDVMDELSLFPAGTGQGTQVLIVPFDADARGVALPLVTQLRAAAIPAEVYPDLAKVKKMLDYANAKQIPYVVLIGSEEVQTGQLTVKNMVTGEQQKIAQADVASFVKQN